MNIYPAILTDSLETFAQQLAVVKAQRQAQVVHVDVIDGYFTDNLTITPMDLIDLDFGQLQLDFHLMTEEPLAFAEEVINYLEYLPVRSVIGQVEKMTSQLDFVELLSSRGIGAGLALDLFTPEEEIADAILRKLSIVQLMAIEAGEQGRQFDQSVLKKLEAVSTRAHQLNPELEIIIDGGVKLETLPGLKTYQPGGVAVGSALWQSPEPQAALESFFNDR